MPESPLFTIAVNNFNYARYLPTAVGSALAQSYASVEVLVIDDGSNDSSPDVIAGFGASVIPILKSNGGQASAFNAGFARARGEFVLFLDADDALEPNAIAEMARTFQEAPDAVKVQSRMRLVDAEDRPLGLEEPVGDLASGDWREQVLRLGPSAYPSVPTSACAFRRSFLERVLPMPEKGFEIGADAYLKDLAPLYGRVESRPEPLVRYRVHGANHHSNAALDPLPALERDAVRFELCCQAIGEHAARLGLPAHAAGLVARRWQHLARRQVLCRHGRGTGGPGLSAIWRGIRLSGTRWKQPLLCLWAVWICLGPLATVTRQVAGLFRKTRIGWQLETREGAHA